MAATKADLARETLEVIPLVMRFIRAQMREQGVVDLSMTQFRSLQFIRRHAGSPLGTLAEHLGLTAPSASKLVDGLERRGLLERKASARDRRMLTLDISPTGEELLDRATEGTRRSISSALSSLDSRELEAVELALSALKRAFAVDKGEPS